MTLNDLRNVIDFTFDIADDVIDASFYIELDEIPEDVAGNIEVVRISKDLVVCKLTDFLRRRAIFNPSKIIKYINENYYDGEQKDWLLKQLTKRPLRGEDILDDGGEAVYHFIKNDMYDFLTQCGSLR